MSSGDWIDQILGLDNVTVETVMARAPDGSDMFEVVCFQSPSAGAGEPAPAANRSGAAEVTLAGATTSVGSSNAGDVGPGGRLG